MGVAKGLPGGGVPRGGGRGGTPKLRGGVLRGGVPAGTAALNLTSPRNKALAKLSRTGQGMLMQLAEEDLPVGRPVKRGEASPEGSERKRSVGVRLCACSEPDGEVEDPPAQGIGQGLS